MNNSGAMVVEMLDANTALMAMDDIAEGWSVADAIANALKVRAAVDADPWHLDPANGGRLQAETVAMVHRIANRNRL